VTDTGAIDAAIAIGYLPWIWRLTASLESWGSNGRNYTLSGSRMLEVPVKFAYWSMSFVMGEAMPDAVLVLGALYFWGGQSTSNNQVSVPTQTTTVTTTGVGTGTTTVSTSTTTGY